MKRLICISIFSLFLFPLLHAQIKKVAMLEPLGTASSMQKAIIRASLTEAITNSGTYEALSRTDIDQVMNEFKFQEGGMVSDDQRKELGRLSGAELLCTTRLTADGTDFFVECSLLEMESGRIVKTANELMVGSPNSKIKDGCVQLAAKLVGQNSGMSGNNNVDNTNALMSKSTNTGFNSSNSNESAILYIYRPFSMTAPIGYAAVLLDGAPICSLPLNSKTIVETNKIGEVTLSYSYGREHLSLHLEHGGKYYIKINVIGPELQNQENGKVEYNKQKKIIN